MSLETQTAEPAGKPRHRWAVIAALVCVFMAGNGFLHWLYDRDIGIGWTHNVIRNWEQFGLAGTHGKMVTNPGGYRGTEDPIVYSGHQPTTLYPVYGFKQIFGRFGTHTLPFHMLTTGAIALAIWYLLGQSRRGLLLAGLAVLSPGFVVWPTILDPNTNTVQAGFIFAALLWNRLRREKLRLVDCLFVLLITAGMSVLNWTAALVHAQVFFWLLLLGNIPLKRIVLYAASGVAASLAIVAISLAAKGSHAGGANTSPFDLLGGYTWGTGGYWMGQNSPTLLTRLGVITFMALLPVFIPLIWSAVRVGRRGPGQLLRVVTPLVIAIFEVVGMRNYFCQHPWMAAPVILLGGILSLSLVERHGAGELKGASVASAYNSWMHVRWSFALLLAFLFSAGVVIAKREYSGDLYALTELVRRHTARADLIGVTADAGLSTADVTNRIPEMLDRRVVEVTNIEGQLSTRFLLSGAPLNRPEWKVVGQTRDPAAHASTTFGRVSDWFRKKVSKRKQGEIIDFHHKYYLLEACAPQKGANTLAEGK